MSTGKSENRQKTFLNIPMRLGKRILSNPKYIFSAIFMLLLFINQGTAQVNGIRLFNEDKESKQGYLSWQLDLTDATNIPNKAVFALTVKLDSGKTFMQKTTDIVFSD
ncbi:MAG: hypothetical protein ACON5F_01760 [Jejuia sp.]